MILPDQPPTFRQPTPAERPWWWRLEGAGGAEVEVSAPHAGQRFANQADAESWVGECWPALAEEGVESVTLFEHERIVYGPMSLHA
ncbi:hypothetical protein [Nocardioides sp.]|uniref:hypothetical protein n=1 Tax=Nocardioides sp. TaxID=35761 RepID=UPI003563D956